MGANPFDWARSRWAGGVSELAVLSPITPGRVPGERRTHEERLRSVLASLADRAGQSVPTPLSKISTFHFARVMIIRPEQYLKRSRFDPGSPTPAADLLLDPYVEFEPEVSEQPDPATPASDGDAPALPDFRSWLMTLVIFDGDPIVYLREIAEFIGNDFDRVFENCEDYPFSHDFERFLAWVRHHQISPDVFYSPYGNLSVARIKQLEVFKDRFDAFVRKVRSPDGRRTGGMDELFDDFLRENQQFGSGFPTPGGTYLTDT